MNGAMAMLDAHRNPEIHHYNQGTHPGINWCIKTVLPMKSHSDPSLHTFIDAWHQVAECSPSRVRIINEAYDWMAQPINGWNTVWIDRDHDVVVTCLDDHVTFDFIDHDAGVRASVALIRATFSVNGYQADVLDRFENAVSALSTYSTQRKTKQNQNRIKAIK